MPRKGQGTRNRQNMALDAMRRNANSRYGDDALRVTAIAVRKRVTEVAASEPKFATMHIRPIDPQPGRGAWLTRLAQIEPDKRPDPRAGIKRVLAMDAEQFARHDMRRDAAAVRRMRKAVSAKLRLIESGRVIDLWVMRTLYQRAERLYRGDYARYVAAIDEIDLRSEASVLWMRELLDEIESGNLAVHRVQADIAERRADYTARGWLAAPARPQLTIEQLPLWDTKGVTPRPVKRQATVAHAENDAAAIMHDNKFFTRGTD